MLDLDSNILVFYFTKSYHLYMYMYLMYVSNFV